ncbi:MAG: GFA family protein [Pseudomonadota bacterium]
MHQTERRKGGCLCSAVRYEVSLPERHYNICHCERCRKWSGGPFMAVHCLGDVVYGEDRGLKWYKGTPWAERGFCGDCGTSLFWRLADDPDALLIVTIDSLDQSEDIILERHIFIDAKPERYDFKGDHPRVTEAQVMAEVAAATGGVQE